MSWAPPDDEDSQSRVINRGIGFQIRARRNDLGMTQSDLADAIGVSQQQVNKYENGDGRMAVDRLIRLCQALQVKVSHFLGGFDVAAAASSGGFAEDATPFVTEAPRDSDAVTLMRAFQTITDKAVRKSVLDHVVTLSESGSPSPGTPRGPRRKGPGA